MIELKEDYLKLFSEIEKSEIKTDNYYGLLSGRAGYILLLYHLDYLDKVYDIVSDVVESIAKNKYSPLYSGGISGLLWAFSIINEDKRITYLDEVINDLEIILIDNIPDNLRQNYDFLHGMTGVVHYLTEFGTTDLSTRIIKEFVADLYNNSVETDEGIHIKIQDSSGNYSINLSISHGMSALIQILSRIYKKGIEKEISLKLLNGVIKFYKNNKNNVEEVGSVYPNILGRKNEKSRMAWCYGDLGIAIAIWQAGDNVGNEEWKDESEKIFEHTSTRNTLEESMVVDPMICHGSSGIATIYNRMWRNTNKPKYLELRNNWLRITKDYGHFDDGVNGYKYFMSSNGEWVKSLGLLEGAIGLSLTYLQASSDKDIRWDRALLICS